MAELECESRLSHASVGWQLWSEDLKGGAKGSFHELCWSLPTGVTLGSPKDQASQVGDRPWPAIFKLLAMMCTQAVCPVHTHSLTGFWLTAWSLLLPGIQQHNEFLCFPWFEGPCVYAQSSLQEKMRTKAFLPSPACGLSHENWSEANAKSWTDW